MWEAAARREARGDWFAPLPAPRRPPCCDTCPLLSRDPINPPAGMGVCSIGHGYHYPTERHWCADHTARSGNEAST